MAFIRNVDKLIEGLENKFFTEARAKAALAPELASEESARQAGDAAEAAARESADDSLSSRLTVVEGSGEGSVAKAEQDAKDYADQKVADLVASAPEVLNTLKELSDALGEDPNFAATISGQMGTMDAKVDQEIADRQSAMSTEEGRAQGAEDALSGRLDVLEQDPTTKEYVDGEVSSLQTQLNSEISSRQLAISDEEEARQLGDSNLSSRVSVLEEDPTTKEYVDGKDSARHAEIVQEVSDRQADVSEEQSRAEAAEVALGGRVDSEQGRAEVAEAGLQSSISAEQTRAQAAETVLDGKIDQEISAREGAISSEQARAEGAEGQLQVELDAEGVRAGAAEVALGERIDAEISDRQGDVTSEESRAMSAESALDGRLDVLESDPTTKTYVDGQMSNESSSRQSGDSSLQSNIDAEQASRESADAGLLASIEAETEARGIADTSLSNALTSEVQAREAGDAGLQSQINNVLSNIDPEALDSLTEVVEAFEAADSTINGAITSLAESASAGLAAEEQRAMAAEGVLTSGLSQEVSDRQAAVLSEQEARELADSSLMTDLQAEEANRIDAVSGEQSRAESAEGVLDGKFGSLLDYDDGSQQPDITTLVHVFEERFYQSHIAGLGGTFQEISDRISANENEDVALDSRLDVLEQDPTTKAYVDEKKALSDAEDLLMFKKDGSRSMTGSILPSADGSINIGSSSLRPDFLFIKTGAIFKTVQINAGNSGTNNMVVGSGLSFVTGHYNTAIGMNSLVLTNSGSENTAMGDEALRLNTTGSFNTALGRRALRTNATGQQNTAIGLSALDVATGSYNVAIGCLAGSSITTGGTNIMIGTNVQPSVATASNEINIGGKLKVIGAEMSLESDVKMNGGQKVKFAVKTTNYTLISSDYVIAVYDTSVSRVMTLPSASSMGAGKVFIIKDITGAASSARYIQIAPQSGQTIDGQSDYKIVMPYESVMLLSTGLHWSII